MFSPQYSISDQTSLLLVEIERLTSHLNGITIPFAVLANIEKQCLVALTHYSTKIEGNSLSLEQVSRVVENQKTYGLVRDEREVKNYFQLLEKMPALIKRFGKNIDSKLIIRCHADMMYKIVEPQSVGQFRRNQNAIYDSQSGKLVYLPPESKDVGPLMADLCQWVNAAKTHPIVRAAIFHNQLVTIHPFLDGNGRSARFLSLYLMDAMGYDWKRLVPIDRTFADDRKMYYRRLQNNYSHNYYFGRHKTDFTPWIEYVVDGVKMILEETVNQVELYRAQNILFNNRQSKILKVLQQKQFITSIQYAARFRISTRMAARDLAQLVEWGKVSILGKARATKYFLK